MSDGFLFNFEGLAGFTRGIVGIGGMLGDLTMLWQVVAVELSQTMHEEQLYEGDVPPLEAWADLSDSTIASRLSHGYDAGPILYASGRGFDSLTAMMDGEPGDETVFEPGPTSMTWGTSVPYMIYHQPPQGSTDGENSRGMPYRPIFDRELLIQSVDEGLELGARALGMVWSGAAAGWGV